MTVCTVLVRSTAGQEILLLACRNSSTQDTRTMWQQRLSEWAHRGNLGNVGKLVETPVATVRSMYYQGLWIIVIHLQLKILSC